MCFAWRFRIIVILKYERLESLLLAPASFWQIKQYNTPSYEVVY